MQRPLAGIRALEFAEIVSGLLGAMQADLGRSTEEIAALTEAGTVGPH